MTTTKHYDPELDLDYDSGGMYCKNLFLKDRKGQFYYVIIPMKSTIDLRKLKETVKSSGNLRFASQTDVQNSLNSEPGAINPFGVMFNMTAQIRIICDDSLTAGTFLYFHPFLATEATAISYMDLVKFMEYHDHYIEVYDLDGDSLKVVPAHAYCPSRVELSQNAMESETGHRTTPGHINDTYLDGLQFETFQLPCCLL